MAFETKAQSFNRDQVTLDAKRTSIHQQKPQKIEISRFGEALIY